MVFLRNRVRILRALGSTNDDVRETANVLATMGDQWEVYEDDTIKTPRGIFKSEFDKNGNMTRLSKNQLQDTGVIHTPWK